MLVQVLALTLVATMALSSAFARRLPYPGNGWLRRPPAAKGRARGGPQ